MKRSILSSAIVIICMFASCSKDEMQTPAIHYKNTRDVSKIVNPTEAPTPVAKSSRDTTPGNAMLTGFTISAEVIKLGNAEHKNEWPK